MKSLIFSLLGMSLFFLTVLTALIVSLTDSKPAIISLLNFLASGILVTIILSPSFLSRSSCHISSVMKGINGCITFTSFSKRVTVASKVILSIGFWYSGLIISRYQPENSSQNNLYVIIRASDILNFLKFVSISLIDFFMTSSIHITATFDESGWSIVSSIFQLFTSLNAFQILFAKLRPCSGRESS